MQRTPKMTISKSPGISKKPVGLAVELAESHTGCPSAMDTPHDPTRMFINITRFEYLIQAYLPNDAACKRQLPSPEVDSDHSF